MRTFKIKTSKKFKLIAIKTIFYLIIFGIFYLGILALSFLGALACVYYSFAFFVKHPNFATILLAIALSGSAILIFIFFVKFFFNFKKFDDSSLHLLDPAEEPEFSNLLKSILAEIGTDFPHKIYINDHVNASVFYHGNFFSMIFSRKKNLILGLGLINSTTVNELKGILAHEFGHFAQRSMLIGAYASYANKIIQDMLFENDFFDRVAQKWQELLGWFGFFIKIAEFIIKLVSWVFKAFYILIAKNTFYLSRQMEFYADAIGAEVVGHKALIDTFFRVDIGTHSLELVYDFYSQLRDEKLKSRNIYRDQKYLMNFIAKRDNLEFKHNLPYAKIITKLPENRVISIDEFATHPRDVERVARLLQHKVERKNPNNSPANSIFHNIEAIQESISKDFFKFLQIEGDNFIDFVDFKARIRAQLSLKETARVFNKYYDEKQPLLNVNNLHKKISGSLDKLELKELFSNRAKELNARGVELKEDLETLMEISTKETYIKKFHFGGKIHRRKKAVEVGQILQEELKNIDEQISINDAKIYIYFQNLEIQAEQNSVMKNINIGKLERLYTRFYDFDVEFSEKYNLYAKLMQMLEFIKTPSRFEDIYNNFIKIAEFEPDLKKELKYMLACDKAKAQINAEICNTFTKYLTENRTYFFKDAYLDENLDIFLDTLDFYREVLINTYSALSEDILNYQLDLLRANKLI